MMQRLRYVLLLAACSFAATAGAQNLVLLIADGLGHGDLSCYNGATPTPRLDTLAGQGTRFNRFYAASSICSPSRAAVLTGLYPPRLRIESDVPETHPAPGADAITLPRLLKTSGHVSIHCGRWDLGGFASETNGPAAWGFDHAFYRSSDGGWRRDGLKVSPEADDGPLPEVSEALRQVRRLAAAKTPFLLHLGFDTTGLTNRLALLDAAAGRIMDELDTLDVRRQTLVLFTSDAGPDDSGSTLYLKGRRGSLNDGGIRVPFLVSQPGVVREGRAVEVLMHAVDLLPSLAEAAGVPSGGIPPGDGVSFLPFLRGGRAAPTHDKLFWRQRKDGALTEVILKSRWKFFMRDGKPAELHNIFLDAAEASNLASTYATNTVPELSGDLYDWRGTLPR